MNQQYCILILISFYLATFNSCSDEQNQQGTETVNQFELPPEGIEIIDAWARPGRMDGVSAIYMNVLNGSEQADTIVTVSSPVARMTEIHETYEREEGMMGMRHAEIVIAPGEDVLTLKPGGMHVMLMQLNQEISEGDSIEFSITFKRSGEKKLNVPVQSVE